MRKFLSTTKAQKYYYETATVVIIENRNNSYETVYTVFGYTNDTYMPLVYVVLSNKDQLTYEFLFGRIMDQD